MNNSEKAIIEKFLNSREKRAEFIQGLCKKYGKTVICSRVNYPGIYKINEATTQITEVMEAELIRTFDSKIIYKLIDVTFEGPLVLMVVDESVQRVKVEMVNIEEEHPLGRTVDLDVYDENGTSISRNDLGYKIRKCFICERDAKLCVRSRAHDENQIKSYIEKVLREFNKE